MLGFEFDSKIIPFSVSNLTKNLSIVVFLVIEAQLKNTAAYNYYFIGGIVISFGSWVYFLMFFEFRGSLSKNEAAKNV